MTQDAATRRGQIERALFDHFAAANSPRFEFSLGVPLDKVALPRAAHLLLRWLSNPIAEHELDWLLSTGYAAATGQETSALQAHMRAVRRRGLESPTWNLQRFIRPDSSPSIDAARQGPPAEEWRNRVMAAQRRLNEVRERRQSPLEWAELVPELLKHLRFAEARELSSIEFQASRRWQQAVETAGSLGFDGRRIQWSEFLSDLARTIESTLFDLAQAVDHGRAEIDLPAPGRADPGRRVGHGKEADRVGRPACSSAEGDPRRHAVPGRSGQARGVGQFPVCAARRGPQPGADRPARRGQVAQDIHLQVLRRLVVGVVGEHRHRLALVQLIVHRGGFNSR